ncbi:MAG: TetR/AcrR family transcriptional regulator [Verrucomicrobiales bacterium]|nr:TetR/AcrR family transcriptional regulator [Verrucomicrobiales bacterium]
MKYVLTNRSKLRRSGLGEERLNTMPWEKTFEEEAVIEQAMQVFWKKGYAATSISDITEATGIKRGSLYNAFEGKDDLFIRALLKYDTERRRAAMQEMERIADAREAIAGWFDRAVKTSSGDPDKKGCLLVNTALDYSNCGDEVQKVVADGFKEVAAFFERLIKRGREEGDIPNSVEPRSTAKALMALLIGLRVMGRGTLGKTGLQQIADQASRLIS